MSNLGGYQTVTTLIKTLGGTKKAAIKATVVVGVAGYALVRTGEAGAKKVYGVCRDAIRERRAATIGPWHAFTATGNDESSGLEYHDGHRYRVLAQDDDATLIEVDGDPDNPYMVSADLLSRVSDYTAPTSDPH